MSRSFLRLAPLLAALALLTPTLGTASAADNSDVAAAANAATLPKGLAGELNAGAPPAIVSFNDLVSAADARRIRAAVVDPATRWVAATDTNGHTVAAQAPPLRYGTSWDPTRPSPKDAKENSVPSLFTLTDALRASGATILAY